MGLPLEASIRSDGVDPSLRGIRRGGEVAEAGAAAADVPRQGKNLSKFPPHTHFSAPAACSKPTQIPPGLRALVAHYRAQAGPWSFGSRVTMVSSSSASPGRLSTPTLTPAMPPSAARRASTRTRRRRPGPSVATSHTARVVSVSCRPEAVAPADAGLEGGTPLSGCQHATLLAVGSPDRSILASQASTGSTLVAAVTLVASTTTGSCGTNTTLVTSVRSVCVSSTS